MKNPGPRILSVVLLLGAAFSLPSCLGSAVGPGDGSGGGDGSTGGGQAGGSSSGAATGGTVGSGGAGRGGVLGTGGAVGSGGVASTGGRSTGGTTATGGRGTGGRGTGGAIATGGRGIGTGGGGTGGVGGAAGAAGWLLGYTATMFGNTSVGDCAGVPNFTDATNISGATCTRQGVTIAPYSAVTANNATFYGAPGDESSIWVGPTCVCQNGDTANAAGVCPRAPSCPMEAVCTRCFEIKCDPAGTGTYSDGATRVGAMYCNANQTAVIQVVDACPHNHPNNPWWCTNQRRNHIDISCSAMKAIAGNPDRVGSWGWLNVQVRPVDCNVGLGVKP